MTRLATGVIEADTISTAWLGGVAAVEAAAGRRVHHLVTRIADPTGEDLAVRERANRLLAEPGHQPVETVANTIFPAAMAAQTPDPVKLGQRYRDCYRRIRRYHPNQGGTYFGRMVDYPHPERGPIDQLAELVGKLRHELTLRGPISARYEMDPDLAAEGSDLAGGDLGGGELDGVGFDEGAPDPRPDTAEGDDAVDGALDGTVKIYVPGFNGGRNGFPCLLWCSFQLDDDHLHLAAQYRSQYMIQRAYGNYLGLARLQSYVAAAAGLRVGELMIVAGYAQMGGSFARGVGQLLRDTATAT